MGCIYKNKGSRNHCSRAGKEGRFCPGSGAMMSCYTAGESFNDVDFSKMQIIQLNNYEFDIEKLKEELRLNPGHVGIISIDSIPEVEIVQERPPYCKFCFNTRVYEPTIEEQLDPQNTPLTDDNDSSSHVVGESMRPYRSIMINSGNGKPLNIEFLEWSPYRERWETVGLYHPKYCPECGRRLNEYDEM